ncbi:hypothetical protein [Streptomyces iakyrus]|uniref:hypothetical protein n=1 Tax=Streptomyces iakyrus TaxID=68219 RepID=UPI0033ED5E0D
MILAGAATAATLAVTAGMVAILPQDGPHASAGMGPRVLSAGAFAEALELAAAIVEKHDGAEPGAKQWLYDKSTVFVRGKPQTSEEWTR